MTLFFVLLFELGYSQSKAFEELSKFFSSCSTPSSERFRMETQPMIDTPMKGIE